MDVQELLGQVADHLSVKRAFGTAYEKNDSLVIPVALVAGGGGGGGSTSRSSAVDSSHDGDMERGDRATETEAESSGGSGGGFGGLVMPAGAYVVENERVRWVPAVNANLLIIVGFMTVRMIARARRRARRHAS